MNWDAIGSLAELVGAFAVIISILYLAAQVKHSASDVRASIIHSLHSLDVELQAKPATDPVLALAVEKAFTGGRLDDEERAQFSMWFYSQLINFEQIHLEYKRLKLESDLFTTHRTRITGGLEPDISRALWNRRKKRFSKEFQDFIQDNCIDAGSR